MTEEEQLQAADIDPVIKQWWLEKLQCGKCKNIRETVRKVLADLLYKKARGG